MDRIFRIVHPAFFLWFAAIILILIPTHTTHAATFTAGNAAELINAITTANSNGETDTITLTADITLTAVDNTTDGANGLPRINSDLTIEGAGFTIARDVGAPDFRIFRVAADGDLTLNGVTLSNGYAHTEGLGDYGGGIFNRGTLMVSNSTLSGNRAGDGGGIFNMDTGTVMVSNSTLSGNVTYEFGGGIYNRGGTVTVNNSTLSGNEAYHGGGIFNMDVGSVDISNSTLSGNSANQNGGGINNEQGGVAISNSTLSGNSATWGGGIYTNNGSVSLINSIVANSTGADCIDVMAGTLKGANNLAGDYCASISLGTVTNLDPVLRDNGGPTLTHALLPGSNAIYAALFGTASDQRGAAAFGRRDIGAFEYNGVVLPWLSFSVDTPAILENAAAGPTVATITVTLDNTVGIRASGLLTVDFALAGTATEGPTAADDYQQAGLPLTFTGGTWPVPGTIATQTFTLTVWDDTLAEGLETINLEISFPGPTVLVGPNTSTLVIIDDDNLLPVSFAATTQTVNEAAGTVSIDVILDVPASMAAPVPDVTVTVSDLGDGSAMSGTDYTPFAAVPLVFTGLVPGGSYSQTVTLTVQNDSLTEPVETVNLGLEATAGPAMIVDPSHSVVIVDDDSTVQLFETVSEQELQQYLDREVVTNPQIVDIERAVVNFVAPDEIHLTVRVTGDEVGDVVVTVTDPGTDFVTFTITDISIEGTFTEIVSRELLILLVESIDKALYDKSRLNLNAMTVNEMTIEVEISR